MSSHSNDDGHSSPIKTPKQLVTTVVAAFVIPIVVIVLLVKNITTDAKTGAGAQAMSAEAVAERIQPIGAVYVKLEGGPAKTGEEVFKAQCSGCHATGALGAPKFGDAGAWGPRLGQGFAALVNSALKGKGNMTPQGGGELSDLEVSRGVAYMANAGGGKFEEPKAAAAADAASK